MTTTTMRRGLQRAARAGLAVLIAGCAATGALQVLDPQAYQKLMATAKKDVEKAIALATKAQDPGAPYRLRCYTTLAKYAKPAPAPPITEAAAEGAVSGYEVLAELDAALEGGTGAPLIPLDVRADCAYIKDQIIRFVARVGAKGAPVPGAAVLGEFLR